MDESNGILVFYVNGVQTIEHDPDPTCSLLQYLRTKLQLTGAKLVCGEGGCGACTVMISKYDDENRTILHYSVNACLTPVCAVHGLAVTTTEGIGSLRTRLHPVQEQIAKHHGSQCGFCTPGMVMSMYTLLRNNPQPSMAQIEKYLEGNLCRCTGYRPILDGCKFFSKEACALGENCCRNKNGGDDNKNDNKVEKSEAYIPPYDPTQEPIFPPELKVNYAKYHKTRLLFDNNGMKWYRPTTLKELLDLKQKYPDAKIIIGNTEIVQVYLHLVHYIKPKEEQVKRLLLTQYRTQELRKAMCIETRFKNIRYDVLIHASNIPELTIITSTEGGIKFGASVTLSKVDEVLQQAIENSTEEKCRVFKAVVEMLKWFASNQIRNTAAIGGNIMTASPISDLNPIFQASTAVLEVISTDKVKRRVVMGADFFTGYRKTVIKNNEILLSITIPFTYKNDYFESYKQALRKEDDIAIVNAGMRVVFEDESDVIKELYLSYGGMAPTTIMAKNTMTNLVGRKWEDNLVPEACQYLEEDLPLNPGSPGGIVEYRKTLTTSFFFKFYLTVTQQLHSKGIIQGKPTPHSYLSAIETQECGPSKGTQVYELVDAAQKDDNPIGRPIIHNSAYQQTTGEAVYIDDMLPRKGELFVAPVYSSRSHATLLDIDPTAALQIPGVKGYIDYRDIPGINRIVVCAEEFFAVDEVTCEGCLIGGVVATTSQTAREASKMVDIKYQDLPAIITVEDAITNDSYWREPLVNECGDVDKGFQLCEEVLEGEVYMGAQEHFYLETQSSIAVPNERDEMDLYSSAQCPAWVQESVAHVLGVPCNKVKCYTKRLGGGFGGKNTQNIPTAVLAAVAAKKYNLPMRCCLERDDDMVVTGTRHPIMAKYTVGYSMDGRIVCLDVNVYGNCGNSLDGSEPTLGNLLRRIDNVYKIPNFRVACHLCKTNTRSNTSNRSCGTVQAIFIIENTLQHIIDKHGMDPIKVREMNFYQEGDRTHVNQIIKDCNIESCWQECINQCDYYNRKSQVEIYNRENRWRKRGICILPLKHGVSIGAISLNQAGALVNVYTDGSVLLAHGGVEMGQGLYIKMIQVASATLGIPANRIHTSETGTSTVPNGSVTAGSTGSDLNGMAVKFACEKICKRLEKYKNEKGSSWDDWVKRAYEDRVSLSATGFYKAPDLGPDPSTNSENCFYYYSYGAGCSEVEIDCLTGDHTVLRTDIVFDVGTSLNPAIDIGQIEGAFMMGHGLHMLEHLKFTPSGTLLTKGPGNYKIPSMGNIPKVFNISLLKGKPNKRAVYSSKAIGEAPMLLSLSIFLAAKSAIMAARHETGIDGYFKFDSPATPDIIRMLCHDEFTKQFPPSEEDNFTPWFVKL